MHTLTTAPQVVLYMDPSIVQVQLVKPKAGDKTPPKVFSFDGVYYMEDTTQGIYDDICFPLVTGVLEGYNGTVFAYGQTGCGEWLDDDVNYSVKHLHSLPPSPFSS